MSTWYTHISKSLDPPKSGTDMSLCGVTVVNAEPRFAEIEGRGAALPGLCMCGEEGAPEQGYLFLVFGAQCRSGGLMALEKKDGNLLQYKHDTFYLCVSTPHEGRFITQLMMRCRCCGGYVDPDKDWTAQALHNSLS
jgi:hypothetical protein